MQTSVSVRCSAGTFGNHLDVVVWFWSRSRGSDAEGERKKSPSISTHAGLFSGQHSQPAPRPIEHGKSTSLTYAILLALVLLFGSYRVGRRTFRQQSPALREVAAWRETDANALAKRHAHEIGYL